MLYYSGFTRRIGDVDTGNTITDFLPAERARGITIQSAAITFTWPPSPSSSSTLPPTNSTSLSVLSNSPLSSTPHTLNLIDTPGHADFTIEVLRSLRVLDGAITILDGVAGVEAQTETVWAQANNYAIPKLVFVNKLDRDGASFARTVKEVGGRLGVVPVCCTIPWWSGDGEGKLKGVGDVVGLRGLRYADGGDGRDVQVSSLSELEDEDAAFVAELRKARIALVEVLAEFDAQMVDLFLDANEDHLAIDPLRVSESLRRCVLQRPQTIVPVFAGASFRNIGVQPLLDAVVDLLPSPAERPDPEISFGGEVRGNLAGFLAGKITNAESTLEGKQPKSLSKDKTSTSLQNIEACALAFKVVSDARRGVLVYVRVYSGTVNRNTLLWNTNLQTSERTQRLLRMYANEAVEIDDIPAGQIGVIPGLKSARTGDTLIAYPGGGNWKAGPPGLTREVCLRPVDVPPPVFFVSVEAQSLAEEKHIQESLAILLREDPSLHVHLDEESGQTHLSGMGELHLEIARDRLVNDFKAKARIGRIEIGYREAITTASEVVEEILEREVGGKSAKAGVAAAVLPFDSGLDDGMAGSHVFTLHDDNHLTITTLTLQTNGTALDSTTSSIPSNLDINSILQSLQTGVSAALARGPSHGYPVHSTTINLVFDPAKHVFANTTPAALSSAARLAVQKALRASAQAGETVLMEPVMLATISVDEPNLGAVVHDISSARGGSVISLSSEDNSSEQQQQGSVDVSKIYVPPDPFAGAGSGDALSGSSAMKQVTARVPLKEMVGYLKHLRSLTAGRGTFTMAVDRFERMIGQRQRAVLSEMRGEFR